MFVIIKTRDNNHDERDNNMGPMAARAHRHTLNNGAEILKPLSVFTFLKTCSFKGDSPVVQNSLDNRQESK